MNEFENLAAAAPVSAAAAAGAAHPALAAAARAAVAFGPAHRPGRKAAPPDLPQSGGDTLPAAVQQARPALDSEHRCGDHCAGAGPGRQGDCGGQRRACRRPAAAGGCGAPNAAHSRSRRAFCLGAVGIAALAALAGPLAAATRAARVRVIVDNDFSGDPDGLFALAHLLLSPSVEVPLVVGSHIHPGDFLDASSTQADHAAAAVRQLLSLLPSVKPALAIGGNQALATPAGGAPGAAAHAIVAEAMREDDRRPLFYAAGAGLTDLALALRLQPRIAERMRLVWIGGQEHPELLPGVPPRTDPEYNFTIDPIAARIVFCDFPIEIWQVPRNVYRQMLVSLAELRAVLAAAGALGAWLGERLRTLGAGVDPGMGETYVLGDSPLVTLTALTTPWEPDSASSPYVVQPTPQLGLDGSYRSDRGGRPMRIYQAIDERLTFADMAAKFTAAGH